MIKLSSKQCDVRLTSKMDSQSVAGHHTLIKETGKKKTRKRNLWGKILTEIPTESQDSDKYIHIYI